MSGLGTIRAEPAVPASRGRKFHQRALSSAVRNEILTIDADQPVSDARTMDSTIRERTAVPRLNAGLLALFKNVTTAKLGPTV